MNNPFFRYTWAGAFALALFLLAGTFRPAAAQQVVEPPEPRASPLSVAHATLDDGTYVKVIYSSPRKRGREIFGGLVPYGEVWRLGANEATEITTTSPLNFGGRTLEPGTYALFAIPGEDEWTIIVNRNLGQWGAYEYDEAADLMRFTVPAERISESYEAFTINFEEDTQDLALMWDQTKVTIPVEPR